MNELLKLLSIPTTSGSTEQMHNHLLQLGWDEGWQMFNDKIGNVYAVKGEAETYPCAVAHIDTVHKIWKGRGIEPVLVQGKIFGIDLVDMSQTGIGGDDKCGIWAAIHCLRALPACKAAFFVDEEVGCKGSRDCDLSFFKDCRYILQADRRGNDDFVNRISGAPLSSDEFQEAVAPIMRRFKYKFSTGMMTDVMQLRDDKVGVSVANMSAGYYNPHRDSEYIVVQELDNVCAMMEAIFREVTDVYPFTYVYVPMPSGPPAGQQGAGYWSRVNDGEWEWKPTSKSATPSTYHDDERLFDDGRPHETFPDHESAWSQKQTPCTYCGTMTLRVELIEYNPPICIDCALFHEEHGFYPIADISGMWRQLQGLRKKFSGKHQKKKDKKQLSGGGNGANGNVARGKKIEPDRQPQPPREMFS